MRTALLPLGLLAVVVSLPVQAQSLQRCKDIVDDSDRLACYDQGFDEPDPMHETPALAMPAVASASPSPTSSPLDAFEGFYLGGGLATGFGPPLDTGSVVFFHKSPAAFGFAGYNYVENDVLLGIEASASSDLFPELGNPVATGFASTLQEVAAPTISARVGMELGDLMVFARLGAGASVLQYSQTGYLTRRTFAAVSAGLGAEMNFDQTFARLEGEVRHVFIATEPFDIPYHTGESVTTYRLALGAGVRIK